MLLVWQRVQSRLVLHMLHVITWLHQVDLRYCRIPNISALLLEQEPRPVTLNTAGVVARGHGAKQILHEFVVFAGFCFFSLKVFWGEGYFYTKLDSKWYDEGSEELFGARGYVFGSTVYLRLTYSEAMCACGTCGNHHEREEGKILHFFLQKKNFFYFC